MENTPALSEAMVASNTFNKYLRQAREDKRIKAVIIRIDSPGGSVLAVMPCGKRSKRPGKKNRSTPQ